MPDLATEARGLSAATGYGLARCKRAVRTRRDINHATMEDVLADCDHGISVGHVGQHIGMGDAMKEPYPSHGEVREKFASLPVGVQDDTLADLLDCPW